MLPVLQRCSIITEDESQSAADEEKAATATMTFEPPHDDLEHCDLEHSPDLSSGETSEGSMEVLNHSETEDMMQVPPEQTTELEKQNDQPSKSDLESDQPSQSDKQDVNATGNIETSGTDKLDDDRETEAGDDKLEQREKQSESGSEREADSEHESEEEAGPSGIQAYCGLPRSVHTSHTVSMPYCCLLSVNVLFQQCQCWWASGHCHWEDEELLQAVFRKQWLRYVTLLSRTCLYKEHYMPKNHRC